MTPLAVLFPDSALPSLPQRSGLRLLPLPPVRRPKHCVRGLELGEKASVGHKLQGLWDYLTVVGIQVIVLQQIRIPY